MAGPSVVVEQEVKLGASATFVLPDLSEVVRDDGATVVAVGERSLTATYWDTSDLRLTRSGLSLRHRTASDGAEGGWTVKLPRGDGGAALSRSEVAYPGPDGEPPPGAVALVTATTRGRPLEPVARLVTRRRRTHVVGADGRVALEVADDEVSVLDGPQVAARFREIEVELGPGRDPGSPLLRLVVQRLQQAGAGRADPTPKIVRALGPLAQGPADVEVVRVGRKASAGEVARAAIVLGTRRLVAYDPGVRLGGDDEDVHQARVATRRLRSDLATFRPLLDAGWVAEVRAELGWVGAELGAVRDADVLRARLRDQAEQLGRADGVAAKSLLRALDAERTTAQARVVDALATPRYVALLDQLVGASRTPPLTREAARPAVEVVPRLAARAWGHLAKVVDQCGDHAPDELLHEVRKKAKRCRYACEAVAPVAGKEATRLAAVVAEIQEELGDLQDAAVAERWLRARAVGLTGAGAGSRGFAAGLLTAVQREAAAEARRRWRKTWKRASAKKLRAWLG